MFIYIHLPFCLSHCIYCDFYVALNATEDRRRAYVDALKHEICLYLSQQENPSIETLYFGGGTPALFSAAEVEEILACLNTFASFVPNPEITLEANPEGMRSAPEEYRSLGINRLSIGVQSLQPNELKRLSRVHSRDQVFRFVEKVRQEGFENISIDLMYGIPEQTPESWEKTLEETARLEVAHISMYGLKVEEGTNLAKLIAQGRMTTPEDETTVDMYLQGVNHLESQGYQLYEMSNLAKPGRASRHNLCYWENREFWGFGVSAHGYIDGQRYENPRDLEAYLRKPGQRTAVHSCTDQEQLENALIFGLRLRKGISIPELEARYKFNFTERYGNALHRYFEADYLSLENGILKLSPKGIPVSNEILASFIG